MRYSVTISCKYHLYGVINIDKDYPTCYDRKTAIEKLFAAVFENARFKITSQDYYEISADFSTSMVN